LVLLKKTLGKKKLTPEWGEERHAWGKGGRVPTSKKTCKSGARKKTTILIASHLRRAGQKKPRRRGSKKQLSNLSNGDKKKHVKRGIRGGKEGGKDQNLKKMEGKSGCGKGKCQSSSYRKFWGSGTIPRKKVDGHQTQKKFRSFLENPNRQCRVGGEGSQDRKVENELGVPSKKQLTHGTKNYLGGKIKRVEKRKNPGWEKRETQTLKKTLGKRKKYC